MNLRLVLALHRSNMLVVNFLIKSHLADTICQIKLVSLQMALQQDQSIGLIQSRMPKRASCCWMRGWLFFEQYTCLYGCSSVDRNCFEATVGNYLVRYMKSLNSEYYFNNQHSWTRFTCPDDRHAEFKIASSFELEIDYDYLTLYGIHSDHLTSITGSFSNTVRRIQIF